MKLMASVLTTCVLVAAATDATAGALEECMIRGDQAVARSCLVEADREAQLALNKAEGDAGKRARDIDTATGRPGAAAALAKSMRAFVDYRSAVASKETWTSSPGGETTNMSSVAATSSRTSPGRV